MRDALNTPLFFIIVTAVMVIAVAQIGKALSVKTGWGVGQRFFSLPA